MAGDCEESQVDGGVLEKIASTESSLCIMFFSLKSFPNSVRSVAKTLSLRKCRTRPPDHTQSLEYILDSLKISWTPCTYIAHYIGRKFNTVQNASKTIVSIHSFSNVNIHGIDYELHFYCLFFSTSAHESIIVNFNIRQH